MTPYVFSVGGKVSDRISSGEIPDAYLARRRTVTEDEQPSVDALLSAEGHGLGRGATSARNERD